MLEGKTRQPPFFDHSTCSKRSKESLKKKTNLTKKLLERLQKEEARFYFFLTSDIVASYFKRLDKLRYQIIMQQNDRLLA